MTEFVPAERGTNIRFPSTAQLCIDSADRDDLTYSSPFDFTITRNTNLMSGFFTRLATTEVMLDWFEPNIQTGINDTFSVTFNGTTFYTATVPQGFYTVKEVLDTLVVLLNAVPGIGRTFAITNTNGQVTLSTNVAFALATTPLSEALFPYSQTSASASKLVSDPDLRLYRYLDITSSQLTYPQNVKDASTNKRVVDTLCRFYMAYDESPSYDAYGFPILLGYKATSIRRTFPFPKQIKWENSIPIGNLSFQVYGNIVRENVTTIEIIPVQSKESNWCLTLQVSEV